jgi:hypothetical protein
MAQCKSCGIEMTSAAASASIFALSFLPVNGKSRANLDRKKKIKMAERVGPLCPSCVNRRKDLAD